MLARPGSGFVENESQKTFGKKTALALVNIAVSAIEDIARLHFGGRASHKALENKRPIRPDEHNAQQPG